MVEEYDKTSKLRIANQDLEQAKFVVTSDKKIAVRFKDGGLVDFDYDSFTIDKTNELKDVYTYTKDAVTVATIEIYFTDTCKTEISGAARL